MPPDFGIAVTVKTLFAVRVGHPEIHVGVVRVPSEDDPDVHGEVLEQTFVEVARCKLFATGCDDGIHLVEGGQFDLREASVPFAFHDLAEQVDGPLVLLVGGEGEGEVAIRLGLFFTHLQDFLEDGDRELGSSDLHEPVAEDAEQLRILQFHLGHVG